MSVSPCLHDTDNSFCPIHAKLHMQVFKDERRDPTDFESWSQTPRSTLAQIARSHFGELLLKLWSSKLLQFIISIHLHVNFNIKLVIL